MDLESAPSAPLDALAADAAALGRELADLARAADLLDTRRGADDLAVRVSLRGQP